MINDNLVSSERVLAKIIADNDLKEDEIKISDIREWIGEAIEKIGAVQQLEHKVLNIKVCGHQAKLPCDLHKLDLVAFSFSEYGGWLPMRKATSSFGVVPKKKKCEPEMIITDNALIPLVKNLYNLTCDREALNKLNCDNEMRRTLSVLVNCCTDSSVNGLFVGVDQTMFSKTLQYTTKPGFINTSLPNGWVKVSYYGIYTDEDGMPMIPDMLSYNEAIYWYVTTKLFYPKLLKGLIDRRDYYDMKNSWNFYRKQAYAEAMMPGVDEMESIKNSWHTLLPETDEHDTFFSAMGDRQRIYNQDY